MWRADDIYPHAARLLPQVQLPEAWSLLYTLLGAVQALCAIVSQLCLLFTVALSRTDGWALIWVCLAPFVVDFLVNNGMRNQSEDRRHFLYATI